MPDRDFAIRAVGRVWAPACRLYVVDGVTAAALEKASEALARTVREATVRRDKPTETQNLEETTAREIESIEQMLSAGLLAPARTLLLESGRNFEQIDAQQEEMLVKMRGDIAHLARQRAAGVTPRRAPHRRPALQSVLSRAVKVKL